MTIGGVDCGARSAIASRGWLDWVNVGVSASGVVTRLDFAKREYDIPITFNLLATSTVESLETQLKSAKKGGTLAVVPDSGDDLGIGATGSVNLYLIDYKAAVVYSGYWQVSLLFRYYE